MEGKVIGQPKPEIKWFNGENMVKENSNIKLESLPDGTQRLIIKNATIEDAGEYRCAASNQYGDVWSDVTLAVKGFSLLIFRGGILGCLLNSEFPKFLF